MHQDGSLPRARRDGLLEETVGEELLLYDQETHTAHCLSPIAACVWRQCDGEREVSELAELAGASASLVADALHELREKDLLDAEPAHTQSAVPGVSRREAIVRVARVGAAAAAGSLIVSATAATPAMAESGKEASCESSVLSFCCLCGPPGSTVCFSEPKNQPDCKKKCTEVGLEEHSFLSNYKCKP